ncbi:MAG: putative addiction module antidote protein [Burkholderiaceae bacterium]|jgi:probable addiction module antidote protein|nr:putative addiction module antidote protein [Burkholderiaceae bacterium]
MIRKIRKNKQQDIREFDIARLLKSKRAITEYLNQVIAEGDDAELAAALGHIARAKGMTVISESSGITREALYKALRPRSKPRFDTVYRVVQALGLRIAVHP